MSAGMFRFRPEAERSEFFKTFTLLYHPGVWILAAASFLEKTGISAVRITESLHLALYCRMELSGGRHDRAGGDPAGQPHVT